MTKKKKRRLYNENKKRVLEKSDIITKSKVIDYLINAVGQVQGERLRDVYVHSVILAAPFDRINDGNCVSCLHMSMRVMARDRQQKAIMRENENNDQRISCLADQKESISNKSTSRN